MKSLEIRSKSKEEAISKAIEKLNVKLDDLEIEVLENPTKGFLGFLGAKDGLYKFTVIPVNFTVLFNYNHRERHLEHRLLC